MHFIVSFNGKGNWDNHIALIHGKACHLSKITNFPVSLIKKINLEDNKKTCSFLMLIMT